MEPVSLFIRNHRGLYQIIKDRNFFALITFNVVLESNIGIHYTKIWQSEVIEFINLPIDERLKIDKHEY
jgi:hypothetical protein